MWEITDTGLTIIYSSSVNVYPGQFRYGLNDLLSEFLLKCQKKVLMNMFPFLPF